MKTLERGFKAWAERTSKQLRSEVGVRLDAPLAPQVVAKYLGVRLITPREVEGMPADDLDQLLRADPWGWSAVSHTVDGQAVVIYNPRHSQGRGASNLMHELAHFLLAHDEGRIILSEDGTIVMRSYDQKQEEEAAWLAYCLLLPREALMACRKRGLTNGQIADEYGVSEKLVEFRLRDCGVDAQLRAGTKRWSKPHSAVGQKPHHG